MLDPSARAENVVGSMQEYLAERLSAVFADNIDFGNGLPFNDAPLTAWLQVRMLAPARPIDLQGPRVARAGIFGNEIFWLLNLNTFVRPARVSPPNNLRIWTLRDAVLDVIAPPAKVPVKDYQADSAIIGTLVSDEIMDDRMVTPPDRTDELIEHNFIVAWRWTEAWTVS